MAFNFRDLNLSGVEISSAPQILKPGRYVVEVSEAFTKQTRNGGTAIELTMSDTKGGGSLRAWVNVHVPSSQTATRIGREQLKALVTFGGHPSPDNPGDIATLKGLKVGASVMTDTYTMDGEKREGSKLKGFFDPSEIDPEIEKSSPGTGLTKSDSNGEDLADESIPF